MLGYAPLGFAHVSLGVDHILFLSALAVLVRDPRRLVAAVTAFTLGHGASIALVGFGIVAVPRLVEAAIAASIVFLAVEMRRVRREDSESALAANPWPLCIAFGLLHGLGFAEPLPALGIATGDLAGALATFTLGIEAGQLLVLGAVLAVTAAARRLAHRAPDWVAEVPAMTIGVAASALLLGRVATLF